MTGQNTSSAVMQQRVEPSDSLDFFPTPPWAVRALCEHLDRYGMLNRETVWEPAAGRGDMARPLGEYFKSVTVSDVHDWGAGIPHHDFLMPFLPAWLLDAPDWMITNPPFRLGEQFARRAFEIAETGVALLVRTAFLEGGARHQGLFEPYPPEWILQFTERVPMFKGRLDPKGSSATAYCWIVWVAPFKPRGALVEHRPNFVWLPPCRKRLERAGDYDNNAE